MTIRKLQNYWFGKNRSGFYAFLGIVSGGTYFAGTMLDESAYGSLPALLRSIGFWSILGLALIFFIHLNLHACHWFLEHFKDTDHLPRRQIAHVNSFCMTLFLSLSLIVLPTAAYGMEPLWQMIRRWFAGRAHPEQIIYPDMYMEAAPREAPDLTELLGEPRPTPPWMEKLDELVRILAYVLIAVLLLLAVRELCRRVWAWITKPRQFDDDEKIYLTPTWSLMSGEQSERRRSSLFHPRSYNDRIRQQYRREIQSRLRKKKTVPSPGASPKELENVTGLANPGLHEIYEKARYGEGECTKEEWELLFTPRSITPLIGRGPV